MTLRCLVTSLLFARGAVLPALARAAEPITQEAAHAIGVDAYLDFAARERLLVVHKAHRRPSEVLVILCGVAQ